jgi:hypothetical protein
MQVILDSFIASFTENLTAQIVGMVALLINVLSYQFNERKKILTMQFFSGAFFTLHYFLLGAYAGAVTNLLSVLRALCFSYRGRYKWASHPACPAIFVALSLISTIFTYQNLLSIVPTLAFTFNSVALWSNRPRTTRIFTIPNNSLFLIYNIANASYSGIISDTFVLVSLLVAFVRFDILKKPIKEKNAD